MTDKQQCDNFGAYRRIQIVPGGYVVGPADLQEFSKAHGVGSRMERELAALPVEITAASAAISLRKIAQELAALNRIAAACGMLYARRRWWRFWE